MGLDITAYSGLTKADGAKLDADGNPVEKNQVSLYFGNTEKEWPGRTEGLEERVIYTFEDTFVFRAGSYIGYNEWRTQLAKLAGYKSAEDCWENYKNGPFYELITFSDCEGVIGPLVARKLAKDFNAYKRRARGVGKYFFECYCDWEKAFLMAANNGAVDFH